jgi:hypothetical protein
MRRLLLAALLLQDPLSDDDLGKLHADLAPPKDEAWRSVAWKVGLLEARERAAKEKKPLFVWSMNGHPLGCV